MDLFVISRYRDTNDDIDTDNQETKHLEKLKREIEERKRASYQSKCSDLLLEPVETSTVNDHHPSDSAEKELTSKNIETLVSDEVKIKPHVQEGSHQEFKILGGNDFEKKSKVKRILPYWLSHSYSVSRSLQSPLFPLEEQTWLNNTLKSRLRSEGVTHLFPVQAQVIPFVLQEHALPKCLWRHDICVSAPTGSGKTLAFVIPIIQLLMQEPGCQIRAMIVLPVQELATQIAKVFKKYCVGTSLKVALLSGSTPLQTEQKQILRYSCDGWVSKADIIVCTAGRLVEHIKNSRGFSLGGLKFLVIDEADRVMDHIQNDWLYHMQKNVAFWNDNMAGEGANLNWDTLGQKKSRPHKLLFSATLSQDPEKLEQWNLFQPKLFSAAPVDNFENDDHIRNYVTPDELQEQYVTCSAEHKPLVLYHFLIDQKWDKVLCFANAAQTAHRLAILLNNWGKGNIKVAELSAALDRTKRDAVLKKFIQSEINVLFCTDALARGIDIPDCNYVISYDPPRNIKTYIHRVGRTGRAGRSGCAVSILQQNQMNMFMNIIKSGGKSKLPQIEIAQEVLEKISESYDFAIQETKNFIHSENNSKVKKSIEVKRGFKTRKRKHSN